VRGLRRLEDAIGRSDTLTELMPRQVIEQFASGTGRVMSLLRLPLIVLVALIGLEVPRVDAKPTLFLAIWLVYAAWSLLVVWWMFKRPVSTWTSWVTTFVDLVCLVALAATSSGATSYLGPVFYLYPIAVAFQYRPRLTATVGFLIAIAYVVSWLPRLGRDGGPSVPLVVWLYAGLLLWVATASTALTVFLVRRSRYVLELLEVQRQLTAETVAVADRERARIAEDLHDGPLQNLIAVRRNLEELADDHGRSRLLAQSDALLSQTTEALRGTVTTLHPQVLAQLGLGPALHELLAQYRRQTRLIIHAELDAVGPLVLDDLLYGTARELLANVTKHARATEVWVLLSATGDGVTLEVVDNGTGLDPSSLAGKVAGGHIGLASRSLRISEVGGRIVIAPAKPSGTRVSVWLPAAARVAGDAPHGRGVPDYAA
jgi:two-component system NarL family sensor kinase